MERAKNNKIISFHCKDERDAVEHYINKVRTCLNKKEADLAILDFTKAIEIDPDNAYVYWWRGRSYYWKAEYDLVIRDFTKVIEIDPDNAEAYRWRGCSYYQKAEYELSIRDFTKAIEIDPDNAEAYRWREIVRTPMSQRMFKFMHDLPTFADCLVCVYP